MSFFDEDDEPRGNPRPRRSAAVGGGSTDQQTVLVRRAVAIGGLVLIFVLLIFALRSCANSRKENALKDYNREVSSIVKESDTQIGAPFFQLLSQASSDSPQDLQTNISGYRVQSDALLKQARSLNVPSEMKGAQQSLLMALEFRRDGLAAIAEKIRTALGDSGDAANTAITQIAGQMQTFLASDVLYQARVTPMIKQALKDAKISGQSTASSRFLPGIEWLDEKTDRRGARPAAHRRHPQDRRDRARHARHRPGLGERRQHHAADRRAQPPAGQRGHRVRRQVHQPGRERRVRRQGHAWRSRAATSRSRSTRTVDTVAKGQTAEATLPLGQKPPTGAAVTVKVTVGKVPGEQKTDNNTASYDVLFTSG